MIQGICTACQRRKARPNKTSIEAYSGRFYWTGNHVADCPPCSQCGRRYTFADIRAGQKARAVDDAAERLRRRG